MARARIVGLDASPEATPLLWNGPKRNAPCLLLAHGAGAGMDSPFMSELAETLGARGVRVARFEFPYMARRRSTGKRSPPDRAPVLLDAFRQVAQTVAGRRGCKHLFIGGKSMGGRMASMIADELGVRGVVCLGYPFHPPANPDKTRVEHLARLSTPCLIVQGSRDAFGTRDEVRRYRLAKSIQIEWVDDGNHDLVTRRSSGVDSVSARERWLNVVAEYLHAM
jgi:predicted alpha/beta-hydrolase family hydrolase